MLYTKQNWGPMPEQREAIFVDHTALNAEKMAAEQLKAAKKRVVEQTKARIFGENRIYPEQENQHLNRKPNILNEWGLTKFQEKNRDFLWAKEFVRTLKSTHTIFFGYGGRAEPLYRNDLKRGLYFTSFELIDNKKRVWSIPVEEDRLPVDLPPLILYVNTHGVMRLCAKAKRELETYKETFAESNITVANQVTACELEQLPNCEEYTKCYLLQRTEDALYPEFWGNEFEPLAPFFAEVVSSIAETSPLLVIWQRGYERYEAEMLTPGAAAAAAAAAVAASERKYQKLMMKL